MFVCFEGGRADSGAEIEAEGRGEGGGGVIFTGAAVLTKAREAIRRDIAALSVAFILFYSGTLWRNLGCVAVFTKSKI